MTRTRMLDGTHCYTGPACCKHADAIRETMLTGKQVKDLTKEERLFIARRQFDIASNIKSFEETRAAEPETWWQCPVAADHRWQASKNKRTSRGDGCPFCSGHRPSSTNNLADLSPLVAAELIWAPDGKTARDLTVGSNETCRWKCSNCGHEYPATPNTRQISGCNNCRERSGGFVLTFENSIAGKYPHLIKDFDIEANGGTADQFSAGSTKNRHWNCHKCGYKWENSAANRGRRGDRCPACAGKVATSKTSLQALYPEVAQFLNVEKSGVSPTEVLPGSPKILYWSCPTGDPSHIHDNPVRDKTGLSSNKKPAGCPFCSNHRVSPTNNIAYVAPHLLTEFDYEGNDKKPEEIIAGSNEPVGWICQKCKHRWPASPSMRTGPQRTGCPKCNPSKTSKPEGDFRDKLKESILLTNVHPDHSQIVPVATKTAKQISVDIIGKIAHNKKPIVVEYDGKYYHNNEKSFQRDMLKTEALLKAGYVVVRIRENGLGNLPLKHMNLLQLNYKSGAPKKHLPVAVTAIEKWILKLK